MPVLQWRNDADGFAFGNSWTFDAAERATLTGLAQPLIPAIVAQVAAVLPFPDPFFLTGLAIAANGFIAMGPLPTYGMCGGMAYLSIDYWTARVPLPRGAHGGDQPARTGPIAANLRNLIWARLLFSLTAGGVLNRTIEWSILLNQVPPFLGGGPRNLLEKTKVEWTILKQHIDAGRPWPLGLIYTGRSIWDQHQIMAYGYEDFGNNTGRIFVYDNNAPHQFGGTGHSVVTLDFRGSALIATSPSDFGNTLAGFFCSNYISQPPPTNLATSFGQFVSWTDNPTAFTTPYGTRLPIANPGELALLGGTPTDIRTTMALFSAPGAPVRPRDGALLREHNAAPVFLYAGGAPFQIPDPTWLDRFGGGGAVRLAPAGTLNTFAGLPDEGTLLREWSDPKVYRIMGGQRRWLTTPSELFKFGTFTDVRIVPDGALASLPAGPILPGANPGECESLQATRTRLTAEIARLEERLADAVDERAARRIRASIARARQDKARADSRSATLQCP